jgi:hypothetical protein
MVTAMRAHAAVGRAALGAVLGAAVLVAATSGPLDPAHAADDSLFRTSDGCLACHNGVLTAAGEDVSIGSDWRASMMANSARDPYWQAAVRRELMDHPSEAGAIEDECATCHMPMARYLDRLDGHAGQVFANLPVGGSTAPRAALAADGVSCSVCHRIGEDGLGTPASFTGGFVVDTARAGAEHRVYGPFQVDSGRARLMRSAAGFTPTEGRHVQTSELCGSCHVLMTEALGGGPAGPSEMLPEQTPYLEWKLSAFREERSCQSCHMPVVEGEAPVTSVLGRPRTEVSRHVFRGGNFFLLRMLARYREELGVPAPAAELEANARRTEEHLRTETARVRVQDAARDGDGARFDVVVENLAGHKLPTAYPSRRAWLHVTVRDAGGRVVFESGALRPDGSIAGNDNDEDAGRYEPHYAGITAADEVQIYESVMRDRAGAPTTGLLSAVGYLKDNRLLPRGFDARTAPADVAVRGDAARDPDFAGGADRVRFAVAVGGAAGPLRVDAELWYQPIAFRWARNLAGYDAPEPARFVRYWDAMAGASAVRVAEATITLP